MTTPANTGPLPGRLEHVRNLRDLGGTPTRSGGALAHGRLLRSASLHTASADDVRRLREAGVRDVVDLRADWELAGAGVVPSQFTTHRLVLVPDDVRQATHDVLRAEGLGGYYRWILDHAGHLLVQLVDLVAQASEGVLVQCGAGKDRTGTAIAVLLDLIDVADEHIAADFARTRDALRAIRADLIRTPGYGQTIDELPPEVLDAPAGAILSALRGVRERSGSIGAHLRSVGLTDDGIRSLRTRLVVPQS